VLFFGALKEVVGRAEEHLQLEPGTDIGRLFEFCASRFPDLARHSATLLFSRNREFVGRAERLQEGDEVAFLPPVSGGAPSPARSMPQQQEVVRQDSVVCALTREPIETRTFVQQLQQGADGAVVVFEGVVRNHSGARATCFLEYEAYEPMAVAKMREIGEALRQEFSVHRIGMVHRLGRLQIGEASVVIVVTSEHRAHAFAACREAIDQLKRVVPIWKKEYFTDGAVWVEGEPSAPAADCTDKGGL
jgi:molybdopterin synthase catalytic subunit